MSNIAHQGKLLPDVSSDPPVGPIVPENPREP